MKKFIALFAIVLVGSTASAQYDMTSTYGLSKDTITNTGTNTIQIKVAQGYDYIAFQPVVTKISGTLTSNSTPLLQGSIDGTNWVTVSAGDTLHVTNTTTNTTIWSVSAAAGNLWYYYRITYTGTATMVATLKCKVLFKHLLRD